MCGIAGLIFRSSIDPDRVVDGFLKRMTSAISHRGPDASGFWCDPSAKVLLGHRRLSILDLTEAGQQPMSSQCGRYTMVFNGEIYNHLELRSEIDASGLGLKWNGSSDTETLLASVCLLGLEEALRRCFGMFALAIWDQKTTTLSLVRDRMGEKPLYYTHTLEGWAFSSELKALKLAPGFETKLCKKAISDYLSYGYVPDDKCIFEAVKKVQPGSIVTISPNADIERIRVFEAFEDIAFNGENLPRRTCSTEGLERILKNVIDQQMLSDVPIGCFLSGGIDSSLVASLMQSCSATQVETFSIGFQESQFDESGFARSVAKHIGTAHTELRITERDAFELIPELPFIYDEPFADSSQIPTTLISRLAKNSISVALTGDGADEVFGGYNRYLYGPKILKKVTVLPSWIRSIAAAGLKSTLTTTSKGDAALSSYVKKFGLPVTSVSKLGTLGPKLLGANNICDLYFIFCHVVDLESDLRRDNFMSDTANEISPHKSIEKLNPVEWMMAMDTETYLRGDILVKVDRASMSTSLETRAPFLDARVVRAGWSLPFDAKVKDGRGKIALREILAKHVPLELTDRSKQGFAIPIDRWLRGSLRCWAEELLRKQDLCILSGLNESAVSNLWLKHQAEKENHGQTLWTILMLFAWLDSHYSCELALNSGKPSSKLLHAV